MKKVIIFLLSVLILVGLVGCSNEQSATDNSTNTEPEKVVETENMLLEKDVSVLKSKATTITTTETGETYVIEGILDDVFEGFYYIQVDKDGNVINSYFMTTVMKLNYHHSDTGEIIVDEKEFEEASEELYEKVMKFSNGKSHILASKVFWDGTTSTDDCSVRNLKEIIKEYRKEKDILRSYTTNFYDHNEGLDWVLTFYESNPYEIVLVINN